MGAMRSGVGYVTPHIVVCGPLVSALSSGRAKREKRTSRSRWVTSRSMRGTICHLVNSRRLARNVSPVPAVPKTKLKDSEREKLVTLATPWTEWRIDAPRCSFIFSRAASSNLSGRTEPSRGRLVRSSAANADHFPGDPPYVRVTSEGVNTLCGSDMAKASERQEAICECVRFKLSISQTRSSQNFSASVTWVQCGVRRSGRMAVNDMSYGGFIRDPSSLYNLLMSDAAELGRTDNCRCKPRISEKVPLACPRTRKLCQRDSSLLRMTV